MQRLVIVPLLAVVGLAYIAGPTPANDAEAILADELRLKTAHLSTDGPGLVAFLSTRAKGDADEEKLNKLIEGLGSSDAATRQKASAGLVAIGSPAIPMLRKAARDIDSPDSAAIARRVLRAIEDDSATLASAAVRLLAARRPPGAAEALLAYLPHVENETVAEDMKTALAGLAYDKGRPLPALLKALEDQSSIRRANAITALCAGGVIAPHAQRLRKLLTDPQPSVRLRASLALAQASDSKAVSTLITLLADLQGEPVREVEAALLDIAGDLAPKVSLGNDQLTREKARDAWARWWIDTEGPGPLQELIKRTLKEEDMNKALALIDKLGDDVFDVRQGAEDELIKMGSNIVPLLKTATTNPDLEIRNRATKCLTKIEVAKLPPLSPITCRMIALRKPKGAVEALLGYIPFAEEESIAEELQNALNVVAFDKTGKAHKALVGALKDKVASRKAAAALAITNGPVADYLADLRKLLKDPNETVRLKTALGLAGAKEQEAVPALIKLVGELPPDPSSTAEEYLVRLAVANPPKGLPEGDDNRKKRSEVWSKWYEDNKQTLVMVERTAPIRTERFYGYTVLVMPNNGMIVEWDKDRKERWKITGLAYPWDAQVLPGNKILIAENNGMRVTERNLKGEILWEKRLQNGYPMSAERLKNGQTFIACANMLVQVDKGGREIFRIDRPHDIRTARRLPNGKIMAITNNNRYLTLDTKGKVLKDVQLPNVVYNQNEIQNNGNVLVPLGWNNALVEYNPDGKEIWRANVAQPMHAVRQPNGGIWISSQAWPNKLIELDKTGKSIAEHQTNNQYVHRVRRR